MTSRRNRAVSMADVAARAGVSTQTVSRVTNGVGAVAPATRERVLSAMRSLGYRPNAAARALKRGSFRSIGVVMFDLTKTGNVATLAAISDAATALGYTVTLVTERSRTSASVSSAFTRLQEMAVDGLVLVIDSIPDDGPSYRLPRTLPLVVLDSTVVPGRAPDRARPRHCAPPRRPAHLLHRASARGLLAPGPAQPQPPGPARGLRRLDVAVRLPRGREPPGGPRLHSRLLRQRLDGHRAHARSPGRRAQRARRPVRRRLR